MSVTHTELINWFQNTRKNYQRKWCIPLTFHNVNYIFHYCHSIKNKIILISIHQIYFWKYLLGMVKHPKEFFTCKYHERSGFWDIGDRKVSLMFGAIQNLYLIFQPPPPPPNTKMTKTWQSCNRPACQAHILYRQKRALHNYHLNKHSVLACINSQLKTTASFCYMVLLIFSRSHQISKHAQILNKQHIRSLCNVTNLCYMVLLIYSVPQEHNIT
jgi:hypothetical protein